MTPIPLKNGPMTNDEGITTKSTKDWFFLRALRVLRGGPSWWSFVVVLRGGPLSSGLLVKRQTQAFVFIGVHSWLKFHFTREWVPPEYPKLESS